VASSVRVGQQQQRSVGRQRFMIPQLRATPGQADQFDPQRAQLLRHRWDSQTAALLPYHRTIEDNVRMLAGRQWDVWSDLLGRYVDVSRYLTDAERRWRMRPVINILSYWFMLTHARLTENPQIVIFEPATLDRLDQLLADALDPIFRTQWGETGMEETVTRATAWQVAAGEVYIETAVDFTRGERRQVTGQAVLSMAGADGSMIERPTSGPVPYDKFGKPLASLTADGSGYDVDADAQPYEDHEGCLAPRVRSPLEVRAEWGANTRWEDKQWIITRSYLPVDDIRDQYGVEVVAQPSLSDGSAGFLERLLFSSGYFGAVSNRLGADLSGSLEAAADSVAVDAMWEKPSATSPETDESPGGRLLICAGSTVLHDSARPYRTKAAGPIRRAQFIQMPGRGGFGSTPVEQLSPIQKTYNRGWAQILEHRNLCTNPILIYDANSGIGDDISNLPGAKVPADFTQNAQPAYYLNPPALSADVWKIQGMLLDLMMRLGSIAGAEGAPQTDDPSGELVSQLRFNSDRPVAVAARSMAHCIAGVAEDWIAILPTIWTDEKTLEYAGEDEVFRNITLTQEMWDGAVNVRPDLENARMETPEAREQRAMVKFTAGIFGEPGTPEAAAKFADYARISKLDVLTGPSSSVDADMVRSLMSQIAQGQPFDPSILKEWYDYGAWTKILREHLASPEFVKNPPEVQQQFEMFWMYVQHAQIAQQQTVMQRNAPVMAEAAATQAGIARVAQEHGPKDPNQPPASGDSPSPDSAAA
jgi:hypothetical protein